MSSFLQKLQSLGFSPVAPTVKKAAAVVYTMADLSDTDRALASEIIAAPKDAHGIALPAPEISDRDKLSNVLRNTVGLILQARNDDAGNPTAYVIAKPRGRGAKPATL